MGLVDAAVVQLEGPRVDVRLERFIAVGEVGKHMPVHQALLCSGNWEMAVFSIACAGGIDRLVIDARLPE
jgi:inhibitor of KinA sporulation pathway (predicted exonuclease)